MTITVGSAFSGIGGMDIAFERAGFEVAWQIEIDKHARSILRRHWTDVPRFEDIRDCHGTSCGCSPPDGRELVPILQDVDIIVGGFPCQDLSVAGDRAGLGGARSGLFFEMVRIIDEIRPSFVIWENVPGLLSSDQGRDFGRVICALADIGYSGAYRVLDAQFFGVAQRRRRVFGVFARGDTTGERCAEILALTESVSGYPASGRKKGQNTASGIRNSTQTGRGERDIVPEVAHSIQAQGQSSHRKDAETFVPLVAAPLGSGNSARSTGNARTELDSIVVQKLAPTLTANAGGLSRMAGTRGEEQFVIPIQAAASDSVNVTSKTNRTRVEFGAPANTLHKQGMAVIEQRGSVAIPILEAGARTGTSTNDPRAGIGIGADGDPMYTLQAGKQHAVATPIAFSSKDDGRDATENLSPTLRSMNFDKSHINGGGQVAIAKGGRGVMSVRRLTPL